MIFQMFFQISGCLHYQLRMFPVDHAGRPQDASSFLVGKRFSRRILPGLREIPEAQHFLRIGMNDPQVAGHIGSRTQEIHRCLAVSGVVFILLQQSSGRDGFPLSFFIQPLVVAEDGFFHSQAFPDVALVITSAEDHHVSCHQQMPPFMPRSLFVRIPAHECFRTARSRTVWLNIAHIRSLLGLPSHPDAFFFHRLGLQKTKASFQEFIQCVAKGQLMVIKIIGDEYHLHSQPCLSAIFA